MIHSDVPTEILNNPGGDDSFIDLIKHLCTSSMSTQRVVVIGIRYTCTALLPTLGAKM